MPRSAISSPFRTELAATYRLAAPLAAANLLQMAVYAIDVIFVARLGQAALAASSLAIALFSLLVYGLMGLTGAVAPLIAAELGRRRNPVREVRRSMRMAFWFAGLGGGAGVLICLVSEPLILLTGQDPALAAKAGGFLAIISVSLIPMLITNILRIFVSVLGHPGFATAITALAIAINAVSNYAFVFGNLGAPALGLMGSALATVVTSLLTLAAYVLAIASNRRMRRYRIFGRWWRQEWSRFLEIGRIGLPVGLTLVAEAGLFSGAAFLMGRIGAAELAAHTIALQVAAFFFQVPYGIAQAATIRVGYHYGAGDREGIGRAGSAALIIGIGFMCLSALAILLFPRLILSAYIDLGNPANAAMIALALQYLLIAAAFQIFDGTQTVAAGVLRGLQDTRVPMIIAIGGYWLVGFGTAIALGFFGGMGGRGVWLGLAAGLVVTAAALLWRWRQRSCLRLLPLGPATI